MRKLALLVVAAVLLSAAPAYANHAIGALSDPVGEPLDGAPTLEKGNWTFIKNFPAGTGEEKPLGVDVEFFKKTIDGDVHHYAVMSSTTLGFSIFDVTDPDDPIRVSDYGAAVCGPEAQVQQLIDILAGGQDFNTTSTALGTTHGWEGDVQVTPDGKIAVIATDAAGRCHDPGWGGMEFVDISDPANPSLLGLVRLQGESHNSTIDPERPWLDYNSNSDTSGNNFIDIVDFSSCLDLDPAKCLPVVSRFQFQKSWTVGTQSPAPSACHDLVYALHRLYGACVNSTMELDPSNVWKNGQLTGTHLTDPDDVGQDNACPLVDASAEAMVDVKVVDCSSWTTDKAKQAHIQNANLKLDWLIRHAGFNMDEDEPVRKDIQVSHKADPLAGGGVVAINDERGGGTNTPPGKCPGGGIWAFDVRNPKNPVVAQNPKGKKAVFVPGKNHTVQAQGSNCTSHLFWEVPHSHHLVAAAWYSSGTQLFRYTVDYTTHPATVRFYRRKTYVPPGASTWTSRIYAHRKDGTKDVYYFAATDIARGFDFFKIEMRKWVPPHPQK
ncbi:MAG TPA: hypothetical protein VFK89_01985 [Actinomycetota bacterium]|nr:hypothetical protein [Actinomycetota bacterium]